MKNKRKSSSESCESVAIICEAKQMYETERDVSVLQENDKRVRYIYNGRIRGWSV